MYPHFITWIIISIWYCRVKYKHFWIFILFVSLLISPKPLPELTMWHCWASQLHPLFTVGSTLVHPVHFCFFDFLVDHCLHCFVLDYQEVSIPACWWYHYNQESNLSLLFLSLWLNPRPHTWYACVLLMNYTHNLKFRLVCFSIVIFKITPPFSSSMCKI